MPNVSNAAKSIQDIMRKDAGTYGNAIHEMETVLYVA